MFTLVVSFALAMGAVVFKEVHDFPEMGIFLLILAMLFTLIHGLRKYEKKILVLVLIPMGFYLLLWLIPGIASGIFDLMLGIAFLGILFLVGYAFWQKVNGTSGTIRVKKDPYELADTPKSFEDDRGNTYYLVRNKGSDGAVYKDHDGRLHLISRQDLDRLH